MALDVLRLGFTDCSIRVGDVGMQYDVSGVLAISLLLSPGNLRGYGGLDLSAVRFNGCSMHSVGCWRMEYAIDCMHIMYIKHLSF